MINNNNGIDEFAAIRWQLYVDPRDKMYSNLPKEVTTNCKHDINATVISVISFRKYRKLISHPAANGAFMLQSECNDPFLFLNPSIVT